jgi:uncharacterized protein YbjT (DUF2867 family)
LLVYLFPTPSKTPLKSRKNQTFLLVISSNFNMTQAASILILGASGRIGGDLFRQLKESWPASKITGTGRKSSEDQMISFDPFADDWSNLPGPFDVVVNCIGAIRESRDMPYDRIHQGLTELLLQHRTLLGNPRIVQVSALGARPDHPVSFLKSKGKADELLLAQPATIVVRASVVCHPETMLQLRLKKLVEMARLSFGKLLVPRGFAQTKVQPILPSDLSALLAQAVVRDEEGVLDAVGAETFTFRELLDMMAASAGKSLKLIEVPREIMQGFVKYFVSVWFPGILNYDQFQLLFMDNTGDKSRAETFLDRPLQSSRDFWENPLPSSEASSEPSPITVGISADILLNPPQAQDATK